MSYCNAEYAMFQVLKGLRGVGDACMLRVVTYSVFLINEILENLFFLLLLLSLFFAFLWVFFPSVWSATHHRHNFNIQTDQRWNGACWLHWMNLTTKWPLVQHKHSANAWSLWAYRPRTHTDTQQPEAADTHICPALLSLPSFLISCDSVSVLCMFFTLYKM